MCRQDAPHHAESHSEGEHAGDALFGHGVHPLAHSLVRVARQDLASKFRFIQNRLVRLAHSDPVDGHIPDLERLKVVIP